MEDMPPSVFHIDVNFANSDGTLWNMRWLTYQDRYRNVVLGISFRLAAVKVGMLHDWSLLFCNKIMERRYPNVTSQRSYAK